MVEPTNIDDVLALIGFGWVQVLMTFACGLLLIFILNEVIGMSLLVVSIQADFAMTYQERSLVQNAAIIGMLLSSHFMGYQMDKIGRKKIIVIATMFVIIFSTISAMMPGYWFFIYWRFMCGIAASGCMAGNITYLAENLKVAWRTRVCVYMCYFAGLSYMYTSASAMLILPNEGEDQNIPGDEKITYYWRILLLISNLPGCLCWAIFFFVLPESAKYYLSVRKFDEAFAVVDWLCRKKHGVGLDYYGISAITQPNLTQIEERGFFQDMWYGTLPLLKRPYICKLCVCITTLSTLFAIGNGIAVWFPYVRNCVDLHGNLTLCDLFHNTAEHDQPSNITYCPDQLENFVDPFIYGVVVLVCYILLSILLCCLKRRLILFFYMTTAACCGFVLNYITDDNTTLIFFIIFIVFPTTVIILNHMIVIDYIPTNMRGKALGLAFFVARIAAIATNVAIATFMGKYCYYLMNSLVAMLIIAAFISCLGPP